VQLVTANCHGQPFAAAQTNVERDWQNAAMLTRGPSTLPPARGKPERVTRDADHTPRAPEHPAIDGLQALEHLLLE
jgi:hypothetical protein